MNSRALAWLFVASAFGTGCAPGPRAAAAPLARDDSGRYTLPVRIDGKGPFPFVLDTGAEMSMIAPALSDSLGLGSVPGVHVNVQGTAGAQASRFVLAGTLASALFTRHAEPLVALPNVAISNARGIQGMNAFRGGRLEVDFAANAAHVGASGATPAGFTPLRAEVLRNAFVFVDVVVDGVKAQAFIDTGARRTVGNLALARALGYAPDDARLLPTEPLRGASVDTTHARAARVGAITLGPATFRAPMVVFADPSVFRAQGKLDAPAMILGVDLLRQLHAIALDYPRAELQVRP